MPEPQFVDLQHLRLLSDLPAEQQPQHLAADQQLLWWQNCCWQRVTPGLLCWLSQRIAQAEQQGRPAQAVANSEAFLSRIVLLSEQEIGSTPQAPGTCHIVNVEELHTWNFTHVRKWNALVREMSSRSSTVPSSDSSTASAPSSRKTAGSNRKSRNSALFSPPLPTRLEDL